ncbi:MAG: SDR family NAD(P)-dependent oxidoreductase [Flavobacteriales bacterium]|nr:SDR family NAD(P)-dependent oxidoreductase [Flavobacteriales bacterium]MDG1766315.1 SDR family NAD(P)-dependent oxidoreductase [Flavobacteriales bacterium]
MMDFKGKKVLITGGSSGLGKATAAMLAKKGADVLITGRDDQKLKDVATELNCKALVLDMNNKGAIKGIAEEVLSVLGGLDILINNAGIGEFALLEELNLDAFERVFQTNVFGLAMLTQALLPTLKASEGDIINIASTAGGKGFAYGSVYAGSKFALRGMTQCWQAELRQHNIRVILVNPSEVPTAFNVADRTEKELSDGKLTPTEIAHTIVSALEMDKRGFIPEVTVWATNP